MRYADQNDADHNNCTETFEWEHFNLWKVFKISFLAFKCWWYLEQWELTVDRKSIDTRIYIFRKKSISYEIWNVGISAHEIISEWLNYKIWNFSCPKWILDYCSRWKLKIEIRFNYTNSRTTWVKYLRDRCDERWDDDEDGEHHVILRFLNPLTTRMIYKSNKNLF